MITFIAHLKVRPENAAAFEALMTHVAEMTHRHEPGVAYYEFAKSVDEPDTYVVVEVYGDIEIHARHMASAWVKESLPKSARLIEGKPDIKQYVSEGSQPVVRRTQFGSVAGSHHGDAL
jgi:quinol monooxygenase YgiN